MDIGAANNFDTRNRNWIISVFRGWAYKSVLDTYNDPSFEELHNYHEDFNRLIEVVERIEAIRDEKFGWFQVHIHSNACDIQSEHAYKDGMIDRSYISDPNAILETKKLSTWYNVSEFILWYNTQTKNS